MVRNCVKDFSKSIKTIDRFCSQLSTHLTIINRIKAKHFIIIVKFIIKVPMSTKTTKFDLILLTVLLLFFLFLNILLYQYTPDN